MQKHLVHLLLIFAICYFGFNLWQMGTSRVRGNDFAHYYASSRIWLEGKETVYDADFAAFYEANDMLPATEEQLVSQATNPPGLILLFAPFATLSPDAAFLAWNAVQVACLIGCALLTWTLLKQRLNPNTFKVIVALLLLSQIVTRHFYYSQVQLLLFLLVLVAFYLSQQERHRLACGLICLATLTKLFPGFLLPWFIWQARTPAQKLRLGIFSGSLLTLGVMMTDLSLWQTFLSKATAEISVWSAANTSLTISSLFTKIGIFAFDSQSTWFHKELGMMSSLVLAAFLYGYALLNCRDKYIQFSLLIIGMLICGPTCWLHYLVFALFPISVASESIRDKITVLQMATIAFLFLSLNHFFMTSFQSLLVLFLFKYAPLGAMLFVLGLLIYKNVKLTSRIATDYTFESSADSPSDNVIRETPGTRPLTV